MTERKPPHLSFESWVDKQVREATERGEFDNLPGEGKPLPDIDRPYDDLWWVRKKARQENVSCLPPALALRREAEDAIAAAHRAGSEAEVRRIVADINDRIRAALKRPTSGPPVTLMPFDADRVVAQWRDQRSG
ncbi:uncharacterized protein DUF1992 [Haloactinospora alba]|uniref:Uncharacterized protein DUF1992 n=1 Tax=Haloactinospora alba TaxID=405555 RepID=A0A543NJA4_9ACTN|nr:DUF1992 domain-containing protein [Haloactinospora alba]TQN31897.1 uncharacterized protein DUF1992 [Haloactinospora alba]